MSLFRQHLLHPTDARKPTHTHDLFRSLRHARHQALGSDRSSVRADDMGEREVAYRAVDNFVGRIIDDRWQGWLDLVEGDGKRLILQVCADGREVDLIVR